MRLKVDAFTIQNAGKGYAGRGAGLYDPESQSVGVADDAANAGPLPRGEYTIGAPTNTIGPMSMQLQPDPGNDMEGRSGFWIHGPNASKPQYSSSEGCIVLPGGWPGQAL